jgi:hypothetical protein
METTVKSNRTWYWYLCGLWCAAGALAVGALLTYLTNWPIGAVAGTVAAVVLGFGLVRQGATDTQGEEGHDLSERLRDSPVYSDVLGNRFYAE